MFKQMRPFELFCRSWIKDQLTLYEDSCPILERKLTAIYAQCLQARKLPTTSKVAEAKPPLINQQCVVYKFKCDLCDADYVGYTCRHLFQRIEEHKRSAIGKHLRDAHNQRNKDLQEQFTI